MRRPPLMPRNAELTQVLVEAKTHSRPFKTKAGPRSDLTELRFRLNNPHRRRRPITLAKIRGAE